MTLTPPPADPSTGSSRRRPRRVPTAAVADAVGANGYCAIADAYVLNGTPLHAQACRQKGGDPATRNHCGEWTRLGYS